MRGGRRGSRRGRNMDGGEYKDGVVDFLLYKDMFICDGIHLTHRSRIKWADEYIKPVLEKVLEDRSELAYLKEIK